jgi:type IV secretory pathway VirJ component
MAGIKALCFYGVREKDTLCTDPGLENAKVISFPGGHAFGDDYRRIAEIIRKEIRDNRLSD